jgi:fatty-acyl-CoA synthase
VIARHSDVVISAVYAVPSTEVGDEVMVAVHVHDPAGFDASAFVEWFDDQSDTSPKWRPRYVRVTSGLPSTQTQKVLKRVLRTELWECEDAVYWRPGRDEPLRRLTGEDRQALRATFRDRKREHLLGRA